MRIPKTNLCRIPRFQTEIYFGTLKTRFNIFGTETLLLGQSKVWKIKITPNIGNAMIGICDANSTESESCRQFCGEETNLNI